MGNEMAAFLATTFWMSARCTVATEDLDVKQAEDAH